MDLIIQQIKINNNISISKASNIPDVKIDVNDVVEVEEPKKCEKKNYVKQFKEKNKEKIKEKVQCSVCYSTYTYFNKCKHFKTKRHLIMQEMQNKK